MLQRLLTDTRGTISMISGFVLTGLIGVGALAAEYGHSLLIEAQNQRVADLAAYSGALVYQASGQSTSSASNAVTNIAALNGISTGVSSNVVASPVNAANQAIQVTVNSTEALNLARVLQPSRSSLSITATAYAQIAINSPACVVALNGGGTGITLTGGTAINAPGCTVASNASVSVHCGDTITTKILDYGGASPTDPCTGIQPPAGTASVQKNHVTTSDPFAADTNVANARARVSSVVVNLTNPAAPSPPTGTNVAFDFGSGASSSMPAGCTATKSSSTWTVTCVGNGPFNFGGISSHGGITINFNTGGSASAVYNFSGNIDFSAGTALSFGPGTFNVKGGILTGGGSTVSFGAGTFNIGTLASSCSAAGSSVTNVSICHTGTSLTFGGPSTFVLSGGIEVGGGITLTMGAGTTNSFNVGADSGGDSLRASGGSKIIFADATGAGDLFQMAGNFDDGAGGGSCITVSAATNHDINGFFKTAGGVTLGAGTYTIDDYVTIGNGGGGDVTCNGVTVGISASGVTFVIGGNATASCSDGSNQIFCVGAGYGHVTITAPASGNLEGFGVIGPSTGSAGADFSNGASSTLISGVVYIPQGQITMSGAATLGNSGSGNCLELIGSQIAMSGGTAIGTTCTTQSGAQGGTGVKITLVQ